MLAEVSYKVGYVIGYVIGSIGSFMTFVLIDLPRRQ